MKDKIFDVFINVLLCLGVFVVLYLEAVLAAAWFVASIKDCIIWVMLVNISGVFGTILFRRIKN